MEKYGFSFDNSYARLPERFFSRLSPTPVPSPNLIKINEELVLQLGLCLSDLNADDGVDIFAGNYVPKGAEPIAMAYAGHQFGGWVPQLGDGRAILLGELIDRDGSRRDVQLKGAGPTPFSRMGDGRAVLGPVLREYIVSEAMSKLGVRTTRTLAAVSTGEKYQRERLLPGAILTRVAESHIRVGTFQFFYGRKDFEGLKVLADHVISRHYPELQGTKTQYKGLFDEVVARQARLIASWQLIGFVHGVMNTDNTSISGETIDYGPCAFMDSYHPATVFSSIDQLGRYAYENQPRIAQWNLACFAETLIPLFDGDSQNVIAELEESVLRFSDIFDRFYYSGLRKKIGLLEEKIGDIELIEDLFNLMEQNKSDFTLTFRSLCKLNENSIEHDYIVNELFVDIKGITAWLKKWRARLKLEPASVWERNKVMRATNPAYIPRNHRVEEVIVAAVEDQNLQPFHELVNVLSAPFEDQPKFLKYAAAPQLDQIVRETFCGT